MRKHVYTLLNLYKWRQLYFYTCLCKVSNKILIITSIYKTTRFLTFKNFYVINLPVRNNVNTTCLNLTKCKLFWWYILRYMPSLNCNEVLGGLKWSYTLHWLLTSDSPHTEWSALRKNNIKRTRLWKTEIWKFTHKNGTTNCHSLKHF